MPGPRSNIRFDILKSPTRHTKIQKYGLKEAERVNILPPLGYIMMRYWTLKPGIYVQGNCPFNETASNFVKATNKAAEGVDGQGAQLRELVDRGKSFFTS